MTKQSRYQYCMEVFKDSKHSEQLKKEAHNIWVKYQENNKKNDKPNETKILNL